MIFETPYKCIREIEFLRYYDIKNIPVSRQARCEMGTKQLMARPHHSVDFREGIANAQSSQKDTWTKWTN